MFYLRKQCSGCATEYKNLKCVNRSTTFYKLLHKLNSLLANKLHFIDDPRILMCVNCMERISETCSTLQILNRCSDIFASSRKVLTRLGGEKELKLTVRLERIDRNNTLSRHEVKNEYVAGYLESGHELAANCANSDRVLRKELKCSLCDKACSERSLLSKHLRNHSDRTTEQCKKCATNN